MVDGIVDEKTTLSNKYRKLLPMSTFIISSSLFIINLIFVSIVLNQ